MTLEMRALRFCSSVRMLAALVFTLLCIQSAHGQPCPYGFEFNRNLGQCAEVEGTQDILDLMLHNLLPEERKQGGGQTVSLGSYWEAKSNFLEFPQEAEALFVDYVWFSANLEFV
ncbi:hypothetical protein AMECASPLE_013886 [Ameca splendens]|uniref:Uncharacterized protein n=1 Tax=Ameca splendens TaxID=208324 RepID=A0ABV0YPW7_9TELE